MTTYRINKQIRASQIRLIDENSKQVGVVSFWEGFKLAQERGLDLVEINGQSNPPVAKLMDYNRFVFEEKQKEKEQRRHQRATRVDIKEIQINAVIQDGDLKVKINNIRRILEDGDKVRIIVKFVGRQVRHTELGEPILEKIVAAIPEAVIEEQPSFEGRNLTMLISKKSA